MPERKRKMVVKTLGSLAGTSLQKVDPFLDYSPSIYTDIRPPPYDLNQLAEMSEIHPIHSAALEQKTYDIVGQGYALEGLEGADEYQRERIMYWWKSCFRDKDSIEALLSVWRDYETLGWGAMEVVRDTRQRVRQIFHVHANTLRVAKDDRFIVQLADNKMTFFKRWHPEIDVDERFYSKNGKPAPDDAPTDALATEILLFTPGSRWSEFYGVPGYLSLIHI